jgi:hypothetical protein
MQEHEVNLHKILRYSHVCFMEWRIFYLHEAVPKLIFTDLEIKLRKGVLRFEVFTGLQMSVLLLRRCKPCVQTFWRNVLSLSCDLEDGGSMSLQNGGFKSTRRYNPEEQLRQKAVLLLLLRTEYRRRQDRIVRRRRCFQLLLGNHVVGQACVFTFNEIDGHECIYQ